MNFYIPNDPAGILEMIWNKAPKLMRSGGGSLSRCDDERVKNYATRITGETKRRVLELAKTGKYTGTEIARMCDRRQSTVQALIKDAGITVPDGRSKARRDAKAKGNS